MFPFYTYWKHQKTCFQREWNENIDQNWVKFSSKTNIQSAFTQENHLFRRFMQVCQNILFYERSQKVSNQITQVNIHDGKQANQFSMKLIVAQKDWW